MRTYSVCISGPIGELLIASTLGCCFVERDYVLASPIEVVMTKDESDAEIRWSRIGIGVEDERILNASL